MEQYFEKQLEIIQLKKVNTITEELLEKMNSINSCFNKPFVVGDQLLYFMLEVETVPGDETFTNNDLDPSIPEIEHHIKLITKSELDKLELLYDYVRMEKSMPVFELK